MPVEVAVEVAVEAVLALEVEAGQEEEEAGCSKRANTRN